MTLKSHSSSSIQKILVPEFGKFLGYSHNVVLLLYMPDFACGSWTVKSRIQIILHLSIIHLSPAV